MVTICRIRKRSLVENGIVIGEVVFEEDLQMSNGEKAVLRRFMKYQE